MANQYTKIGKRLGAWSSAALLLAAVGCAFPQGRYGGDPMLGNFNRPIVATPPVWNGGDPGMTPAYDGGARLGMTSPDVPTPKDTSKDKVFIVPTFEGRIGFGKAVGGGGSVSSEKSDSSGSSSRRVAGNIGARLPMQNDAAVGRSMFVAGGAGTLPSISLVNNRPYGSQIATSGANFEPTTYRQPTLIASDAVKNPADVATVEEGRSLLSLCGAKTQRMEQDPTGEWRYSCTLSRGADSRFYEARSNDQVEAVRAVMIQVQKDR